MAKVRVVTSQKEEMYLPCGHQLMFLGCDIMQIGNPAGYKFCPQCGRTAQVRSIPITDYCCGKCGEIINKAWLFCAYCGEIVEV